MNPFEYIDFERWFGWTYEAGGTTGHMQTVQASHDWNAFYGRGDLTNSQWNEYLPYAENEARKLIDAGQNESPQGVRRYWELVEAKLLEIGSPRTAAAAGAGVSAARAHEGGTTEKKDFPWWLLAGGAALLLWRK